LEREITILRALYGAAYFASTKISKRSLVEAAGIEYTPHFVIIGKNRVFFNVKIFWGTFGARHIKVGIHLSVLNGT
jgi:hypothetical protein